MLHQNLQRLQSLECLILNDAYTYNDPQLFEYSQQVVILSRSTIPKDGFCSGFVFAKDNNYFLITAAHCLRTQKDCREIYSLFDFSNDQENDIEHSYLQCDRLIYASQFNSPDIAIAQLKIKKWYMGMAQSISKNRLSKIQSLPTIKATHRLDKIAVIGHPQSLSMKVSNDDDCIVNDNRDYIHLNYIDDIETRDQLYSIPSHDGFFVHHTCDIRGGNSGGPVFVKKSQQWYLTGIISNGARNWYDLLNQMGQSYTNEEIARESDKYRAEGRYNQFTDLYPFLNWLISPNQNIQKNTIITSHSPLQIVDGVGQSFICPNSIEQFGPMDSSERALKDCLDLRELFIAALKERNMSYSDLRGTVAFNHQFMQLDGITDLLTLSFYTLLKNNQEDIQSSFSTQMQIRKLLLKINKRYSDKLGYIYMRNLTDPDQTLSLLEKLLQSLEHHYKPVAFSSIIKIDIMLSTECLSSAQYNPYREFCISPQMDDQAIDQLIIDYL